MIIKLRSGTTITDDLEHYQIWKARLKGDPALITFSTDAHGVIVFWSDEIAEIWLGPEEIAESMK